METKSRCCLGGHKDESSSREALLHRLSPPPGAGITPPPPTAGLKVEKAGTRTGRRGLAPALGLSYLARGSSGSGVPSRVLQTCHCFEALPGGWAGGHAPNPQGTARRLGTTQACGGCCPRHAQGEHACLPAASGGPNFAQPCGAHRQEACS